MSATKTILYVNACVRGESRTNKLAKRVLETFEGEIEEVKLSDLIEPIRSEGFITYRNHASEGKDFSDPAFAQALQFARADVIVIAAPYWDMSFPAILKAYFEQINVIGVTFEYTEEGFPRGLCRADKLVYVTTAGGPIISDEYGFGYVKALAENFYGIKEVIQIKAEGLDVVGADVLSILDDAYKKWDFKTLK